MQKTSSLVFFLSVFLFGLSGVMMPDIVSAGPFTYEALEAIPGSERTGEISPYLHAIYRFALWAVGIAALFMLSIGGMMYLTSAGNTSQIGTAKKVIFDALIGLTLALVAWLILYVINPQLIEANLDIFAVAGGHVTDDPDAVSSTAGGASHNGSNPAPTGDAVTLATFLLKHATTAGSCSSSAGVVSPKSNLEEVSAGGSMTTCHYGCNGTMSLCTRTSNVSQTLLQGLADMSADGTGFTITSIAGGSHSMNSMHYSGNAADVGKRDSKVRGYVDGKVKAGKGSKICDKGGGVYEITSSSGAVLYFYDEDSEHWHIQTTLGGLCR